jgi:tRNA (cmo5U34)-methyltransferase
MTSSIDHIPSGSWSFDEKVGECFDDMVARSVPLYRETLELVGRLAARHMPASGQSTIIDLGCSNGQALELIGATIASVRKNAAVRMIGVDSEQHMLDRARARLGSSIELIRHDLRDTLPYRLSATKPNVVTLLWTAQFVPIELRARLFREIREIVAPDGAMFVAEKLRGQTSRFEQTISDEYRAWKMRAGYSRESVEAKATSLQGILVSLSAPEQKQFMASEGWAVEEVCRYLGFATYYCLPR